MASAKNDQLNWDDLKIILAICRNGSLSGAARALGTSHSTVFRQINAIEKRFATRFFNRLPHGYEMTEAGEAVLRSAASIEDEILELSRTLLGRDLRLQGSIRLTAPEGICHYLLSPHLASFHAQHPQIQLDLLVTSNPLELSRREADLAIRVTNKPPQNCIGQKVCEYRAAMYASKTFLARSKHIAIHEYDLLMSNDGIDWLAPSIWKNKPKPNIVFTSDSILPIVNAAIEGIGAAILPCFIGDQESKLQRITTPLPDLRSDIWLLVHADLRQTARVKTLMAHLHQALSAQRGLIEGNHRIRLL